MTQDLTGTYVTCPTWFNTDCHTVMAKNMEFMIRYNTTKNASQVGQQSKSDSPKCQPWCLYKLSESEYFSCSKWLLLFNLSVLETHEAESQFIGNSH